VAQDPVGPMCLGRQAQKGSYFNAQFLRLRGRRGPKKAACAVAASLLTTIYRMLKDGTQFQDLGVDHFDRRSKDVRASSQTLASMPSSLPSPKRPEIVAMLTQIEPLPPDQICGTAGERVARSVPAQFAGRNRAGEVWPRNEAVGKAASRSSRAAPHLKRASPARRSDIPRSRQSPAQGQAATGPPSLIALGEGSAGQP
jgi:hypothetical protein